MRPLLAFVILTIGHAAYGQSESYPPKLAGLLQSGDYVGINRNADTGTTRITVYPERVFNVLRDAHDLDEESLEQKYPELQELKEQYKKDHSELLTAREDGKVRRYKSVKVYSYRRTGYARVAFVGKDYFIVKAPGSDGRGSAIAFNYIEGISWQENVPFSATFELVDPD